MTLDGDMLKRDLVSLRPGDPLVTPTPTRVPSDLRLYLVGAEGLEPPTFAL